MSASVPISRCPITVRPATLDDVAFMDGLQKNNSDALGYFPTKQFEGYIAMSGVLIAESDGQRVGYVISRDRYLKRDELGVIFQLCISPSEQRKLVGAELVREVFARSAYGCRLYCCWCAQDLPANSFWECLGFVPIAFRAGSSGKKRVHIFWQRRTREGDATPYWFPSQTNSGAIREDRLVFPIPPGVHWRDVKAVVLPTAGVLPDAESPKLEARSTKQTSGRKSQIENPKPAATGLGRLVFARPEPKAQKAKRATRERVPRPRQKTDPRLVAAARELRDRYLERVNAPGETSLILPAGKYEVARSLEAPRQPEPQRQPLLPNAA